MAQALNVSAQLDSLSTQHLNADLKGRSLRGGLLTGSSQGAQFLLQSISTVVLARMLTPADYGLVAMVVAITGIGQAFADLGLSEATIQRPEINHDQISALFWINVGIGLALMLVTMGLAPVFAWFYREPRLKDIALVVSFTFLIGGLRVQHTALLKRQMRFMSLAIRDVASWLIGVPVAIIMAWRGAGYWAIVALPLTVNFTQMTLSWLMVRWIPGPPRRGAGIRSLVTFGGKVAASYLLNYVNRSSDSVLIGWYWGAGPLGLYSRAYNLLMLPIRQLIPPADSVVVPAFSRVQGDPERFARYFLRSANLMVWITAPMFGFLFVAAEPVIVLTLGKKWQEAAPVFQILVIAALAQVLFNLTIWLFVSRGQSGRLLRLLLIISPVIVGSFAIGLPFSIKGVALSGSLGLVGILVWVLKYAFRGTNLTLQRLGRAILPPIALCLGGIFSAELSLHLLAPQRIVSQLLVVGLGFAVAYSFSALIPAVRQEIVSLRALCAEMRFSSQAPTVPRSSQPPCEVSG
jgi:PST family polysaccharide transporter